MGRLVPDMIALVADPVALEVLHAFRLGLELVVSTIETNLGVRQVIKQSCVRVSLIALTHIVSSKGRTVSLVLLIHGIVNTTRFINSTSTVYALVVVPKGVRRGFRVHSKTIVNRIIVISLIHTLFYAFLVWTFAGQTILGLFWTINANLTIKPKVFWLTAEISRCSRSKIKK